MTLSKCVALGLLLGTMAICLTACGGSDSTAADSSQPTTSSESGHPAITKAELIKKGDVICTRTDSRQRAELKVYEADHPSELTGKVNEEKTLRAVAIPPVATEVEELEALGAPAGDESKVAAIIAGLKEAVESIEAETSILMVPGEGPFAAPDKLAAEYGFKACAKAL